MPSQVQSTMYLEPTSIRDGVERLGLGGQEELIERLNSVSSVLVSDVYALQQFIYEHHLAGDMDYGFRISELLEGALTEIYPVTETDLLRARTLADDYPNMRARERLHVAVMLNNGVGTVITGRPDRYRHVREIEPVSLRSLLNGH